MKIDIWSDVVCPFCYIGKRHLEQALDEFPDLDADITWRSFELDPNAPKESELDIYDTLAKKYGRDREWAIQMNESMTEKAADSGLTYNLDSIKPTNSFDAHQLLHHSKKEGKQSDVKERLFSAYFVEGENISSLETLTQIGEEAGLNPEEIQRSLENNEYTSAVNHDVMQAKNIGIQGVPFFLIDHKYGLSGAQPVETFIQVLRQVKEGTVEVENG